MEQILLDFIENDEAKDAYITSKVTYISLDDVNDLLKRQKEQLRIGGVSQQRELLLAFARSTEGMVTFNGIDESYVDDFLSQ